MADPTKRSINFLFAQYLFQVKTGWEQPYSVSGPTRNRTVGAVEAAAGVDVRNGRDERFELCHYRGRLRHGDRIRYRIPGLLWLGIGSLAVSANAALRATKTRPVLITWPRLRNPTALQSAARR